MGERSLERRGIRGRATWFPSEATEGRGGEARRRETNRERRRTERAKRPTDVPPAARRRWRGGDEVLLWIFCSSAFDFLPLSLLTFSEIEVGRDPRPVMREAYNMFRDGGDPEKQVAAFSRGRESEYFYASLYVGLYYESQTLFLMGSCIYWKPFAANIVDCFYDLEETNDEFFYQNRDFGMMGEFKQELRDGFIEACLHLVNRDYDALAKDFVTLWVLPPTADKDAVTKALTGVFKNAVAKGVHNISFGDLLGNLGTTMYKFKFQIPSYFSLVIRRIAHRLSMKCKISLVYSSDLKRPLDIAEAIISSCGDLEV